MRFAAFHPGKIGDALYSLPFLRYVYGVTGERIDFFTSDYCEPMRTLFEYQPCIKSFNIAPGYKIERMDMGCQPPHAHIEGYDQVFQLGFRSVPDRAIHQFIAAQEGITIGLGVRYRVDYSIGRPMGRPYVCIAPRGETSFNSLFRDTAQTLLDRDMGVVVIGGAGDNKLGLDNYVTDLTGYDLLFTAAVIGQSEGFLGLMSSQLVLANGFDIPRIAPHDNRSWDMRHVVYTPYNHYPINPRAENIVNILKG